MKRTILITGANGGMGLAMAESFLAHEPGATLFLGVRSSRSRAQQLVEKNRERSFLLDLDVTQPESWKSAISILLEKTGRIDVLVNNAGQHVDALLATMRPEDWNSVIETNLNGSFHGCQAVLPTMISQRFGRIINLCSLSALLAPAGQTNYAAAKAGVLAMTQSLAKEVARLGITVNAIAPGYIETEALATLDPERRKSAQLSVPMRRFGKPEEVAAAVRFLASTEASYITGSILKIDGGIL
ncbi:MAG: SDR family NAD(P)-dependent oxidoreductase [Verrucomicrobiota bacterium]|nr:SDR family NAD(P)-dependent oxidoreductase [Verrucomicrobiota bacterium]